MSSRRWMMKSLMDKAKLSVTMMMGWRSLIKEISRSRELRNPSPRLDHLPHRRTVVWEGRLKSDDYFHDIELIVNLLVLREWHECSFVDSHLLGTSRFQIVNLNSNKWSKCLLGEEKQFFCWQEHPLVFILDYSGIGQCRTSMFSDEVLSRKNTHVCHSERQLCLGGMFYSMWQAWWRWRTTILRGVSVDTRRDLIDNFSRNRVPSIGRVDLLPRLRALNSLK